jgi:hypothetical protein
MALMVTWYPVHGVSIISITFIVPSVDGLRIHCQYLMIKFVLFKCLMDKVKIHNLLVWLFLTIESFLLTAFSLHPDNPSHCLDSIK